MKILRLFVCKACRQKACLGKCFHPCCQKVTFNFCYKKQAMRPPDIHTLCFRKRFFAGIMFWISLVARTTKSSSFWARFLARFPPKPIEKASRNVRRTDRSSRSIEAFTVVRESALYVFVSFWQKCSGRRLWWCKNDNGRKIFHTHFLFLSSFPSSPSFRLAISLLVLAL